MFIYLTANIKMSFDVERVDPSQAILALRKGLEVGEVHMEEVNRKTR